jgi:preprotein translocase subunit SecG
MKTLLTILQFVSALGLIAAVLIHSAKGDGMGGIGGQAHIFGSQKDLEAGLDKLTWWMACGFLALSAVLGVMGVAR